MFNKVTSYFNEYSKALFVVDQQKLSKSAKSLLLIFIISVFIIIGWGLSWQKAQTKSPYKLYGYECTHLIDKKDDIKFDYFKSRNSYIYSNNNYSLLLSRFGDSEKCNQLGKLYISFIKGSKYQEALKEIKNLENLEFTLKAQISKLKNSYSDMLLEKISKQDKNSSILTSSASEVSVDLKLKENKLNSVIKKIKSLKVLDNYHQYTIFNNYYQANRELIKDNRQSKKRLYRFKRTLQAFGFLFPIWLIFYIAYKFSLKRKHFILANLTINVANVSALFGLLYLIDFIYTIIPKIFLEKLIAIFMQYNLTIILNTLVIIFFIIVFGILIYIVQRNHSTGANKRKDEIKNLTDGKCSECATIINGKYCVICGFKHYKECESCSKDRLAKSNFCQHCGE